MLKAKGRYSEAEDLAREVLDGRLRRLGEDHFATLKAYHELARILQRQKKFTQAEDLTEQLLEKQRLQLGALALESALVLFISTQRMLSTDPTSEL